MRDCSQEGFNAKGVALPPTLGLGLVFVVTLAVLILASVLFVIGVSELLGIDRLGVVNPPPLPDRLF